ncbi:hypothetical protein LCGC14_1841800 [marine sediment metagenome]|uniref:Uncharacterized protein n=1 Tax=marine sediment metagenome TaxID=412755 RepID=A0A0F9JCE5_9ZZZZ
MTDLEDKAEIIRLLANQLVSLKFNEFKNYDIAEDATLEDLNAEIRLLNRYVKNAKLNQAKVLKVDKLEQDRANLSDEELKQLEIEQGKINEIADSILATLDPRASLKGKLYAPNSVILRFKGKIGSDFSKDYPFGVLM